MILSKIILFDTFHFGTELWQCQKNCEGWLVGVWDSMKWDGSHRFWTSSHQYPTRSHSTKMPNHVNQVRWLVVRGVTLSLIFHFQVITSYPAKENVQKPSSTIRDVQYCKNGWINVARNRVHTQSSVFDLLWLVSGFADLGVWRHQESKPEGRIGL